MINWRSVCSVGSAVTAFPACYKYCRVECGDIRHHEEPLPCCLAPLRVPLSLPAPQHLQPLQGPQGLQPLQHRPVPQHGLHLHQLHLQQWVSGGPVLVSPYSPTSLGPASHPRSAQPRAAPPRATAPPGLVSAAYFLSLPAPAPSPRT